MSSHRLLLLTLLSGLAVGSGCASDTCKPSAPGFELVVKAGARASEIRSLEVAVVSGSDRRKKVFDLGAELSDGTTSMWIALDPPPTGDFTVQVYVAAFAQAGAAGVALVNGSHEVRGSASACNRLELVLADPASDAGLPQSPDAMVTDAGVPLDATTPDGGVNLDAEPTDAPAPDIGLPDSGLPDTGLPDSGLPDSGIDAGSPDAANACVETVDPGTVALYRFQNNLADETGAHPGSLGGMNVSYTAGQRTCGSALTFPQASSLQGWARIPDDAAFHLASGSIDLWTSFADAPPFGNGVGVVSRDAVGSSSTGHLTVYASCEGYLVAKLDEGGTAFHQCTTDPVAQSTWSHVLVNFGPPGLEIWLDGVRGTRTGTVHVGEGCAVEITCGTSTDHGIDGNDNAWILGASADLATDGAPLPTPLHLPMRRGKIDSLRISSIRR